MASKYFGSNPIAGGARHLDPIASSTTMPRHGVGEAHFGPMPARTIGCNARSEQIPSLGEIGLGGDLWPVLNDADSFKRGIGSSHATNKHHQENNTPHFRTMASRNKTSKIKIALSVDFDAISAWLGTGAHPKNTTSDYSAGYFSATTGVPRLLRLFQKLLIADKVTWCIPGHSIETFPSQTKAIIDSGAEIALHGYSHESASQMTAGQEEDVLKKCIQLVEERTGTKPRGYRAPLYQLSERTISLLQRYDFLWDSSLSHYDCHPYYLPLNPAPIEAIKFGSDVKASSWMHPSPNFDQLEKSGLVEIPCNWYMEDATPLQFYPNNPNTQGYVDVRVIEQMWMDRFEFLMKEREEGRGGGEEGGLVFSLVLHPETSGMAHVIGMVERFLKWLQHGHGEVMEFGRYGDIAEEFKKRSQTTTKT